MAFAFEKLLVYQRAIDFSDAVCAKSEGFPRGYGCGRGRPKSSPTCWYGSFCRFMST